MRRPDPKLREEISAASAAYLFNALPDITKLPEPEIYRRLANHIQAALFAYEEGAGGLWDIQPSEN